MAGPRRIGSTLSTIAGQALGPMGLAYATLVTEWASIVGPRLAEQALPLKLQFPAGAGATARAGDRATDRETARQRQQDGVLHLEVSSAAALFIQHEEPQIVQRLNSYFGYRVVARLKLVHGAGTRRRAAVKAPPRPRRLSPLEESTLHQQTGAIDDPDLREALDRLGRAILESP